MPRSAVRSVLRGTVRWIDDAFSAPGRSRRRPRVLIEVKYHVGLVAVAPLVWELHRRSNLEVSLAWSKRYPVTQESLREFMAAGIPVHETAMLRHRRFECVVQTERALAWGWRFRHRTYLHHGSGAGNSTSTYSGRLLGANEVEFVLAINDEEVGLLAEMVADPLRCVRRVGGLKVQTLLSKVASYRPVAGRRRVLVLSHWDKFALHKHLGRKVLAHLAARGDVEVVVSAHPHLLDRARQYDSDVDWLAMLQGWANEFGALLVTDAQETIDLMAAADLMVADHTSATLEFAALGRPFAYFKHPQVEYLSPALSELLPRAGHRFGNAVELPDALDAALARIGEPASADQVTLVAHCFPETSDAVQRAADAVEQIARSGTLAPAVDRPMH